MLANLIERLRDKRPLRRRQLTKRVALNMLPALLTVALLLWAFAEQFFVLLPFVSANGSTLPVYKGAPKLHAAGMVLVFGTAWALVVAHFVRVVITDNNPATNPPCSQLPQSCLACRRCHGNKPDRCHHCSACNLCCLKMDHHCPWVGCCVGFYNYKFFVMFLLWTVLMCLLIVLEVLPLLSTLFSAQFMTKNLGTSAHLIVYGFAALTFIVSVSVLLFAHFNLMRFNSTTLEATTTRAICARRRHGVPNNEFDLGTRANFAEVLGDDKLLWLLPVFTSKGDGYTFPRSVATPDETDITKVYSEEEEHTN